MFSSHGVNMETAIYDTIIQLLADKKIPYEEIDHPAVATTDDSARFRGEAGWNEGVGSKNILFHAKGTFYLVVTTASAGIKARLFKKEFGTKDIRFATAEELAAQTGAVSGAVPPFGHLGSGIPTFVDKRIFDHPYFMFNPGVHTKSIRIRPSDLYTIYSSVPGEVRLFAPVEEGLTFTLLPKE